MVQAAVRCRLAHLALSRRQQAADRATQAAVALQAAWRAVSARRQLQRLRCAALVLQAAWRGRQARLRLAQRHAAATVIQAHVRGYLQRKKWVCLDNLSSVKVHSIRHARILHRCLVTTCMTRVPSQCRCALTMLLEKQHAAASTMQAWWRGSVQRRKYLQLQRAIVAIQATVRMRADRLGYVRLAYVQCMPIFTTPTPTP